MNSVVKISKRPDRPIALIVSFQLTSAQWEYLLGYTHPSADNDTDFKTWSGVRDLTMINRRRQGPRSRSLSDTCYFVAIPTRGRWIYSPPQGLHPRPSNRHQITLRVSLRWSSILYNHTNKHHRQAMPSLSGVALRGNQRSSLEEVCKKKMKSLFSLG